MSRLGAAAVAWLALAWAAGVAADSRDERALVAVASAESPVALTLGELRLAFLAVPVGQGDVRPKPVLNRSSQLLYEVFLQKVIFLSSQHYQRQLVAHVFQSGGARPATADSEERLVELLREDPQRVSFMWARDAARHEGLKVVRVLWKGSVR